MGYLAVVLGSLLGPTDDSIGLGRGATFNPTPSSGNAAWRTIIS